MEIPEWIIMLVGRLALENEALRINVLREQAAQTVSEQPPEQ